MPKINFRSILKRAARLTLTIRGLLFFGFITAIIGGGGELDFVLKSYQRLIDLLLTVSIEGISILQQAASGLWQSSLTALTENTLLTVLAAAIYVLIILAALWLFFVSQSVLIEVPALAEKKKVFTFKSAMRRAHGKYWQFLCLYVLRTAAIWLPFIVLAVLGALFFPNSLVNIGYFLFFLVFIPLAFAAGFLTKFTIAGLMIDELPFWQALKNSFLLFGRSWLATIEFAVLLLLVGIIFFTVGSFLAIILFIPFLLLAVIFGAYLSATAATLVGTAGAGLFFLTFLAAGLLFAVFEHASWSLFYLSLEEGGMESKLARLFHRS